MARQSVRLTYEDYVHFPADRRWELIEGVPHVVPSPNARHQDVGGAMHLAIGNHLSAHGGGRVFTAPFDVVLRADDIVQPDLVFISDADAPVLTKDNVWGTPTWVIEVLSNPYYERDKLRRYEAARVPEHWLLNPYEDTLTLSLLEGTSYRSEDFAPPARVRPRCLPALEIDLGAILKPF